MVHILRNDFPDFHRALRDIVGSTDGRSRIAWIVVTENLLRSELSGTRFHLPRLIPPKLPEKTDQAVLLLDDGESKMTAHLLGGSGLIAARMRARLDLMLEGEAAALPIFAKDIAVASGGRDPVLTFDSIKAWKLGDLAKAKNKNKLSSSLTLCTAVAGIWSDRGTPSSCDDNPSSAFANLYYRDQKPDAAPALFDLKPTLKTLPLASGKTAVTATLYLTAKKRNKALIPDADGKTLDKVLFSVIGADSTVVKVSRPDGKGGETVNTATAALGKYTVSPDSTLSITFDGVAGGAELKLEALGLDAKGGKAGGAHVPIEWTVAVPPKDK